MSRKSESKTISIPADAYERLDAAARERDLSAPRSSSVRNAVVSADEDVRREAIRLYAKGDPRKRMIAMNIETIERNRRLLAEGS
jgi:hypothetical protein